MKNSTKEKAKKDIQALVKYFEENKETLKKTQNETETRNQLINPFFKALGWDINNSARVANHERDVIHEDVIRITGKPKNPDYSFRIKSKRCFFVEAKKPGEDILNQAKHAYQIRRYGWSGKLPVSILTDFEEFSVYDCTIEPRESDKSHVARLTYITYDQYIEKFDWLWEHFSKEAVAEKRHEQLVQLEKKGSVTVDAAFLCSLDKWRATLAASISQKNKKLSSDDINTVVQLLLNRLVFLRICEDRGLEPYGDLHSIVKTTGKKIYQYHGMLQDRFNIAKNRYNSGLFSSQTGDIVETVKVENKVLATIISEMYYPQSPYEFSVLSVEIMGTAYERFLGKVISVDENRQVAVDEKPEVRKAGGVFYTPQYIVDYIVEHTVGAVIKGKTPEEIAAITICDPACGSGSFLLGVYKYLIQYHEEWYQKNRKGKRSIPLTPQGNLKIEKKKEILLNNIYGVDLDEQAVEVTKLSLLLQCLEGENDSSLALQYQHVLPNINENIKSGNSLVDFDFYDDQLDFQEEKKIKPFNWQTQFLNVFRKGGFDVIVGNPPYVQPVILDSKTQKYLSRKYSANTDLYSMFIEFCFSILKKDHKLGFIVPSLFIKGVKYDKLRNVINNNCSNVLINEYGDGVFLGVKMPTCVIFLEKGLNEFKANFFQNSNSAFFDKVNTIHLSEISHIRRGLEVGRDKLGSKGRIVCLTGSDIDIYRTKSKRYISSDVLKKYSKNSEMFLSPKIIVRETGNCFFATLDAENNSITTRSLYNVRLKNESNSNYSCEVILGILCSKLFKFYFKQFISPETNIFPKIRIAQLKEIPIPASIEDKHKMSISSHVNRILELNSVEPDKKGNLPTDVQNKIMYHLFNVDKLVYELYELSDDEIQVIEESV